MLPSTCAGLGVVLVALAGEPPSQRAELPVITFERDDTKITQSCRLVIPPGTVIADANGDGLIHIEADDVEVHFEKDSILRGALVGEGPNQTPWDALTGVGIRIAGRKNVKLVNPWISGCKVGVKADGCDGLTIEGGRFTDNFRQRLKSTPWAEDSSDWLWPHKNDGDEWATSYGAAISVREARGITIRDVIVRTGQNGILIHRVNDSKIYDNDCSYLSGWGLGMFRSSGNVISRNSFDYCIRGHSEGVYNRGQDSAGILCFEQCSSNVFVENSATHGGDGFFGFAGLEALNGEGLPAEELAKFDFTRRGCNDNLFYGNDFSYASAHGFELTFSFGNKLAKNIFHRNAICGIWGGYSQDFLITDNEFGGNGDFGYGMEHGGINIEHGSGNVIVGNSFDEPRCGVHLWWDPHGDFETKTWGKANYRARSTDTIDQNTFFRDHDKPEAKPVAIRVRDTMPAADPPRLHAVKGVNAKPARSPELILDLAPGVVMLPPSGPAIEPIAAPEALGTKKPVNDWRRVGGRESIIMGTWGPWDPVMAMVRLGSTGEGRHVYEFRGFWDAHAEVIGAKVASPLSPVDEDGVQRIAITPNDGQDIASYTLIARDRDTKKEWTLTGSIIRANWNVIVFPWTEATDPRTNLQEWRDLARGDQARQSQRQSLNLAFGHGGPRELFKDHPHRDQLPSKDRFGLIATTSIRLPAGKWKFTTLSDDGIRVMVGDAGGVGGAGGVNAKPVIENWTWHGPATDSGIVEVTGAEPTPIIVEYFEIDGFATLKLEIERAD